jgi:hypothetical protein
VRVAPDFEVQVAQVALDGFGLSHDWQHHVLTVPISEFGHDDFLRFHPMRPRWAATWNSNGACADSDPVLLPVADGPDLGANADEVGGWVRDVLLAVVGRKAEGPSYRDWLAEGYATFPDA